MLRGDVETYVGGEVHEYLLKHPKSALLVF